jgi:NitT/TauT family transport system permease protein
VLVIAAWEGGIALFHVQQFLLPRPSDIVKDLWIERHLLWPAGWYTFKEALGGFAIGSALGMLAATFVSRF